MLTLKEIIDKLQDRSIKVVAEAVGLHYFTVLKIAKGRAEKPAYATIEKLSKYFEREK